MLPLMLPIAQHRVLSEPHEKSLPFICAKDNIFSCPHCIRFLSRIVLPEMQAIAPGRIRRVCSRVGTCGFECV